MSAENQMAEYPVFDGQVSSRMNYIDGYDPSSLMAPHSSLLRTSTWVGMGLVLSSLAAIGLTIFGAASSVYHISDYASTYLIIGLVLAAILLVGGFGLIQYGRRYYYQYRAVRRGFRHSRWFMPDIGRHAMFKRTLLKSASTNKNRDNSKYGKTRNHRHTTVSSAWPLTRNGGTQTY